MPINPDYYKYTDLRILDKDPEDIYQAAVAVLQARNPDWTPETTNVEVMLLEALSVIVAESIFSINRLPRIQVEAQLALLGVSRDVGAQPTTVLAFEMVDDSGYVIPPGTEASVALSTGEVISFTTDEELIITEGNTVGTVNATGAEYTSVANGTPSGTELSLLSLNVNIFGVSLDEDITGGRDPESEDRWLERGIQRIQRFTEVLVIPQHFVDYALEQSYVQRATYLDLYDPGTMDDPGDNPGHVTVIVYGDGAFVSNGDKEALTTAMQNICTTNLVVHVIDPTVTSVDVDATIIVKSGYESATVITNVTDAVTDYVSTAYWDWDKTLHINQLIAVIGGVEGVAYVDSVTTPASDMTLGDYVALATPGTINITEGP